MAYKHLDASVKGGVDALLKLNPDYSKWAAGAYAFVHAATGPDNVKRKDFKDITLTEHRFPRWYGAVFDADAEEAAAGVRLLGRARAVYSLVHD